MRFLISSLTTVAVILSSAVAYPEKNENIQPTADDVDGLLSEVPEQDPVVGTAKLLFADQTFGEHLPREQYRQLLKKHQPAMHPLTRFRARRLVSALELSTPAGKQSDSSPVSVGRPGSSGCLTDWMLAGPFDNASADAFDRRLPPETGASGPYDGVSGRSVRWRSASRASRLCRVDIHRLFSQSSPSIAYLSTEVKVDTPRAAKLLVGASGPYRIWINGKLKIAQDTQTGFGFDQRVWPVELPEGTHRITVKIASTSSGQMSFAARLVDRGLEPVTGLKTSAKRIERKLSNDDAEPVDPTGEGILGRLRASDREPAVWPAWLWRHVEPAAPNTPWRDWVDVLRESAKNREYSAFETVALSPLLDRPARRIEIVRSKFDETSHPLVRWHLASLYRDSVFERQRFKEKQLLEQTSGESTFWPNAVAHVEWFTRRGYTEKALSFLEANRPTAWSTRPSYLTTRLRLTEQLGQYDKARNTARLLAKCCSYRSQYGIRYAEKLLQNGEPRNAIDVLKVQAKLHPLSYQVGLEWAQALRVLGQIQEAEKKIAEWIKRRPHVAKLYQTRAELLVELGRKSDAIGVLENGVAEATSVNRIRDRLAYLKGESKSYYEDWVVENLWEKSRANEPKDYSTTVLVDQTIVRMTDSGLARRFVQVVRRVNDPSGVSRAGRLRVSFRRGDETVEVKKVRILKPDGRISTEYDSWRTGGTRKGARIYNDTSYLNVRAANVETGDLVEYRYEVEQIANENFRGDYFGDVEYLQTDRPIAFQRYIINYPRDRELYFRWPELPHKSLGGASVESTHPDDEKQNSRTGRQYQGVELQSVPAVQAESKQPGYSDIYDYLLVSNKKSYDEIAKWWWKLVDEQLVIDDKLRKLTRRVTSEAKTTRQKVAAIHNYVVQTVRYLHVGLGIHGWKPYRTTSILRNRYGDCKDTAALMKIMLEEAGIEANLVLVRTRDLGHVAKHPANMHVFNHAIAYVPELDLYLDGTARYHGIDQLPPMDQGAQAVVVKDGGDGGLVELPVDDASDNQVVHELTFELDPEGDTQIEGRFEAHGEHAVQYRRQLQGSENKKQVFESNLSDIFGALNLRQVGFENLSKLQKPSRIDFEASSENILQTGSSSPFIYPIGFTPDLTQRYARWSTRRHDLVLGFPFEHRSSIEFRLPQGYRFGQLPEPVHLESPFGRMDVVYQLDGRSLTADVEFAITQSSIDKEEYPAFRSFVETMTSKLRTPIAIQDKQK